MPVSASAPSELSDKSHKVQDGNVNQKTENAEKSEQLPQFAWMVKPCHFYKEEYSDCKSFKARFHQYFVHGETLDCSQWNEDYKNCYAWSSKEDYQALRKLVDSERERAKTRLKAHFGNDVWEPRMSPPPHWNSELPKEISKEYENSFLKLKADELKSGKATLDDAEGSSAKSPFSFDASETSCSIV